LWSLGSLWTGRGRICRHRKWARAPLVKGRVLGWRLCKLTFKGLPGLLLLLNLMRKDTNLINSSELLQFNHITILRLKSSQVSNYGLFLRFLNVTLDHEFLKLTCVFLNIEATSCKVMEFRITILNIGWREKL